MILMSSIQISQPVIPVTIMGGSVMKMPEGSVIEDIEILEEAHDIIEVGVQFNVIFHNMFLGGVYPFDCRYYPDYAMSTDHRIWKCHVVTAECIAPGTSVFQVEKTHAILAEKKALAAALGRKKAMMTLSNIRTYDPMSSNNRASIP